MAAITFAGAIELELRALAGTQRLVDLSRAADPGETEVTARTIRFAQNAAAKCEAKLGSIGAFDDADATIGDRQALDWATRWAWLMMRGAFAMAGDIDVSAERRELLQELDDLRMARVQEAAVPQVADTHD
jgi:hypothetical protein